MDGPSIFYARCVPKESDGGAGQTKIFRVDPERDEIVDTYAWYSPDGVHLGWSPIGGQVAVMSLRVEDESREKQVEFAFHLQGRLLRSYTLHDLAAMGVEIAPYRYGRGSKGRERAIWRFVGREQVEGSNQYDWVVEVNGKDNARQIRFDILTGKPRVP